MLARLGRYKSSATLRNTAWMAYSYGLGLVLQGGYFVILARTLEADRFGLFAASLALVSVLTPFAGFGGGNVLVMSVARDQSRYPAALGAACVALAGSCLIFVPSVVIIGSVILGTKVTLTVLFLGISELVFGRLVDLAAQVFQAHERLRNTANINVFLSFSRLVAVGIFAVVVEEPSVTEWAACYAAASCVSALLAVSVAIVAFGLPARPGDALRDVRRYGLAFSVGSASKSVYSDIDKTMLERYSTSASAGIYTAAYRLVAMSFAPIQALVYSSNTRLYRLGSDGCGAVWAYCRRAWPAIAGYAIAVALCLVVAAPLAPLLLGDSFEDSASALRWLALMPVIQGTHYLVGDSLMALGKQHLRAAVQVGVALLNVVLNFLLIPTFSWKGAVFASYICEGLLAVITVCLLYRYVRHERPNQKVISV